MIIWSCLGDCLVLSGVLGLGLGLGLGRVRVRVRVRVRMLGC